MSALALELELERFRSDLGEVYISAKVVEQLIRGVIGEQDGLLPLDQAEGNEGLLESLARAYRGSGIEVGKGEEGEALKIKLQLVARYGVRIHEAARWLIRRLRERLRELADLEVSEVEIEVTGLRVPRKAMAVVEPADRLRSS